MLPQRSVYAYNVDLKIAWKMLVTNPIAFVHLALCSSSNSLIILFIMSRYDSSIHALKKWDKDKKYKAVPKKNDNDNDNDDDGDGDGTNSNSTHTYLMQSMFETQYSSYVITL